MFHWFVGIGITIRLLEGEIAAKFLAVLSQPCVKRLLSSKHFSVDGTLIRPRRR